MTRKFHPKCITISLIALILGIGPPLSFRVVASEPATQTTQPAAPTFDWSTLTSPILLQGDDDAAFRDPLLMYHEGTFRLFYSYTKHEKKKALIWRVATSTSTDLVHWTPPKLLAPEESFQEVASPGSIIRFGGQWVMCMQTYPTNCHLWITRSKDLQNWSPRDMLMVKGPDVPVEQMGRMIDPCIFEDKDEPSKYWCFWKQNGAGLAWSRDLKAWNFVGHVAAGENVGVFVDGNDYVMVSSPSNGIALKRSPDLKTWSKGEVLLLGQSDWPWAQGRLTAGCVVNWRNDPRFGKYVMVFHGNPGKGEGVNFTRNCSIGIAWSDDLKTWDWPGMKTEK